MTVIEKLRQKANTLPQSAGVYIMKDAEGGIIYVGKSKKLKNRVSSYFSGAHNLKTTRMVSLVRDFDIILCKTEMEALTLENVLIKKHSPKYNIKLKDSKTYPYIKVTGEEYPRLVVTRERTSDKSKYYGPYSSAKNAYAALDAIKRIFALPTCNRIFPRDIGKSRPCIYKDMGRCAAPCDKSIDREGYLALVRCAEQVLDGNILKTKERLTLEMNSASQMMEFERAAVLRDSICAIDSLVQKQKVVADASVSRDVFSVYTSDTEGVLAVLSIRDGALINKNTFMLSLSELTNESEIVNLIADYYDSGAALPRQVMIDAVLDGEEIELLSDYLSQSAARRVEVRVPQRGDGRALCDMARENARESARQFRLDSEREDKNLKELSSLLGISIPHRIEAYDISNVGNECIVASMVVFIDGKPRKSDYRLFTIGSTDTQDDYASMREALSRRLAHIGDATASLGERPDLILLDGGAAHVGVGKEVLSALSLDISLYGMVKDDYHKTRALTDGVNDISIAHQMNVFAFIYKIQEEAHRFAYTSSQKKKTSAMTHSTLEKIEGIGPKKARLLLGSMSLNKIRHASVEQLGAIKGISTADAKRIYAYYHKNG